jgi:hypothetical protein
MLLGKVNMSIKDLLKKSKFTDIDVKLMKGLYIKASKPLKKKKTIYDTFVPNGVSHTEGGGSKIVRKFKDFVIKHTQEDDEDINIQNISRLDERT